MARKQDENLIPNSARTPSERRENATKAGIASGKARRQKKTVAEYLKKWADSEVSEKDKKEIINLIEYKNILKSQNNGN